MQALAPAATIGGYEHSAPWRRNSWMNSASSSYSFMPGRHARIARLCARTAMRAAWRITPASARLLKSRISCSRWSSATSSLGAWPLWRFEFSVWMNGEQLLVELVAADRVVDAIAALEQARQDVVQVRDRERVVGAVRRPRRPRARRAARPTARGRGCARGRTAGTRLAAGPARARPRPRARGSR